MLTTSFVVCLIALGLLIYAEGTENLRLKYAAKPLASAAFVAVALVHIGGAKQITAYATWVIIGLVFGGLGDICLMLTGKRWFLAGMAVFGMGHAAYIVAFGHLLPWTAWWSLTCLAPVLACAVSFVWLRPHLGSMLRPVSGYMVIIGLMAVGAVAATATGPTGLLAGLGAAAFFFSDLAVARDRFIDKRFINRLVGLPLYYGGQLLIASSLGAF